VYVRFSVWYCSQDFRCLFLISLLAVALLCLYSASLSMVFVWRYFLYDKFFCYTIIFISSSFFVCLFVNALYFPRLSSVTCEIMVLLFLHAKQYCCFLEFLVVSVEFLVCIATVYFRHWLINFTMKYIFFVCSILG